MGEDRALLLAIRNEIREENRALKNQLDRMERHLGGMDATQAAKEYREDKKRRHTKGTAQVKRVLARQKQ